MGRVINPNSAGKQRKQLLHITAIATRELLTKTNLDLEVRDLAAFISFSLGAIYSSIEPTVSAWEKRGYWVKADRFRSEWSWADSLGKSMAQAICSGDWEEVQNIAGKVRTKLAKEKISNTHRYGMPWVGAWDKLRDEKNF